MRDGIVPVMEVGNNNSGGFGGFGNSQDWAWIIILFLIFGFNGNRGFGNGGFGGGYIPDGFALQTDFATLERKLDGVNNGLCDGFYNMAQQFSNTNQNIFQSTANLQNTLTQGFAGLNQGLITQGYETRLGTQMLGSELANCCCDIRQEIAKCCCETNGNIKDVSYNIAMGNNALQNIMCNNTRDIVEAQNCGTRAILDAITNNRIEDKNAQIQAQQNEINALRLSASQAKQNAYLLNELKPCPSAAYIVPNPNCCYDYSVTRNNCCNNGCY